MIARPFPTVLPPQSGGAERLSVAFPAGTTVRLAGVLCLVAVLQLSYGADFGVLVLGLASLVIGLVPILYIQRDLYTCLCAIFCLRYTGCAILLKTWYGQPLQSNLEVPFTSYALALGLQIVVTAVALAVRRIDKGKSIFPALNDTDSLRSAGLLSFLVGVVASAMIGILQDRMTSINTGAVFVTTSALSSLVYLGLCCECVHRITVSRGESFLSARLAGMIISLSLLGIFLNARGFAAGSVACVFWVAFMYRAIRPRDMLVALACVVVFTQYISPIALDMRNQIRGMSTAEVASTTLKVISRSIDDPGYLSRLRAEQYEEAQFGAGYTMYDYFGDNNNIANRVSWIALIDRVAGQIRAAPPVNAEDWLGEIYGRALPSFLSKKATFDYGQGDWLSWQIGLSPNGYISYLSFGLPNEGLVVFGVPGFLLFPVIFLGPLLWLCSRVSSLRVSSAPSLFLITSLHANVFEGTSDVLLSIMTRQLPLIIFPALLIYWISKQRRPV